MKKLFGLGDKQRKDKDKDAKDGKDRSQSQLPSPSTPLPVSSPVSHSPVSPPSSLPSLHSPIAAHISPASAHAKTVSSASAHNQLSPPPLPSHSTQQQAAQSNEPILPGPLPQGRRILEMCMTGELHHLYSHSSSFRLLLPFSLSRPIDALLNTPLHLACANDDLPLVALLLRSGADPEAKNRAGGTPYAVARAAGFVMCADLVRKHSKPATRPAGTASSSSSHPNHAGATISRAEKRRSAAMSLMLGTMFTNPDDEPAATSGRRRRTDTGGSRDAVPGQSGVYSGKRSLDGVHHSDHGGGKGSLEWKGSFDGSHGQSKPSRDATDLDLRKKRAESGGSMPLLRTTSSTHSLHPAPSTTTGHPPTTNTSDPSRAVSVKSRPGAHPHLSAATSTASLAIDSDEDVHRRSALLSGSRIDLSLTHGTSPSQIDPSAQRRPEKDPHSHSIPRLRDTPPPPALPKGPPALSAAVGAPNMAVHVVTSSYTHDPTLPLPTFAFPRRLVPTWDAARLGRKRALALAMEARPGSINATCPRTGATPLMKAAWAGHAGVVRALLARGADPARVDKWGFGALVWACLGGHSACAKEILTTGGPGANPNGVWGGWWRVTAEDGKSARRVCVRVTPLVAAAYSGSADTVEVLLDAGADVDARVGPGRGATAVTVAAWMVKEDVVKCLVERGARVEGGAGEWLHKGVIYMKNKAAEGNAFIDQEGAVIPIGAQVKGGAVGVDSGKRKELMEKLNYFDAQEGELVRKLDKLLSDASGGRAETRIGDKKGGANVGSKVVKNGKDAVEGADGKDVIRRKSGMMTLGRRTAEKLKHGLNLESLGNQTDLLVHLIHRIPDKGTELDVLCLKVYQSVIQLVMSANKNTKHHFVAIVASAILNAGEIVREIEKIEPREFLASPGITAAGTNPSATASKSSPTTPALLPSDGSIIIVVNPNLPAPATIGTHEVPLFALTESRGIMRSLMTGLRDDCPKRVMYATKIAVGVWPPPNAIAEMIQAATDLARVARRLADVANTTGHWLPNKKLELNVTPFEDSSDAAEPQDRALKTFDYNEYKRRNELKAIEAMSKSYDSRASADTLSPANVDPNQDFFNAIEAHKKQFAVAVQELASAQQNGRKDQYATLASSVHANVDALLDEVNKFDLLTDFSSDIVITKEDSEQLGLALAVPKFPAPLKPLWVQCLQEAMNAIDTLVVKAKLASGVWPPPTAATEMIKATIPCVVAVKKLVVLTREATTKIRKTTSEDRKKKEEWRRQWQQNERVKKMFQMLENQFWEKQEQDKENVSDGDVALNLTKEEEEILKDSQEGLVVEMNAGTGKEITKGGKLAKLVECLTGHKLPDLEFNSTFLMTHHSFTTSRELLELIIRRYDITPPYGLSQKSFDVFLNKKILPIRIRCCIALKDWISEYFDEDWADDELLVLRFREFVEKRVASDFQKWSQPLLNLLNEKLQGNASPKKPQAVPAVLSPELPLTPKHITNPTQLTSFLKSNPSSFLEIEPLEMARQVTLVEFEYYRAVRPNECLDQIWGERRMTEKLEAGLIKVFRKGDVSSPHISKMINHTNNLTTWVASCVVNNENIKDRVNMMRYFAQFAVACIDCNNFNGATAVVAGLTMSPVTRLHKTWELFREKHAKLAEQYDQIREVVSPKGQYSNYRKALKALQPPVLPFLGVYLTDLTFVELGNQDFLPESHLINFDKRRKAAQIVREILQHQSVPFSHRPVTQLQEFLQSLGHSKERLTMGEDLSLCDYGQVLFTQDELYDRSLEVEPKEESSSEEDDEVDDEVENGA